MGTHLAIAAASTAILGALQDGYPRDEFGPGLQFVLYQPKDFDDPIKEGVAVCLWRIAPNTSRRSLGPRTDLFGRRFKPSIAVDLYYLIAPYADQAERQQRLLGWVLRAIEDFGPLAATQLNHYLAESDVFADSETLDLVHDPLVVGDQLTLWDRVKKMPPAATYVMRMVLLDSEVPLDEFPIVRERDFGIGTVTA